MVVGSPQRLCYAGCDCINIGSSIDAGYVYLRGVVRQLIHSQNQ